MAGMVRLMKPISSWKPLPGALSRIAADWQGGYHHTRYAMALYEYRKVCVATYKRVWQQAFEMLEPTALKGARWVPRRGGGGNASFLSDYRCIDLAD